MRLDIAKSKDLQVVMILYLKVYFYGSNFNLAPYLFISHKLISMCSVSFTSTTKSGSKLGKVARYVIFPKHFYINTFNESSTTIIALFLVEI